MPVTPTYPGVYIEEIPSGVRTITGVATSITAFLGRAARGPVNEAVSINSYSDFERTFGGLWVESTLGYAVRNFYLNGGSQAIIVRLFNPTLSTQEARKKAEEAAKAVADAAAGADPQAAAAAARTKANTYTAEPEKTAADKVAKAAEAAAISAGATVDTVKAAAGAVARRAQARLVIGAIMLEADIRAVGAIIYDYYRPKCVG
jgi:phage tail sheath protein FI